MASINLNRSRPRGFPIPISASISHPNTLVILLKSHMLKRSVVSDRLSSTITSYLCTTLVLERQFYIIIILYQHTTSMMLGVVL